MAAITYEQSRIRLLIYTTCDPCLLAHPFTLTAHHDDQGNSPGDGLWMGWRGIREASTIAEEEGGCKREGSGRGRKRKRGTYGIVHREPDVGLDGRARRPPTTLSKHSAIPASRRAYEVFQPRVSFGGRSRGLPSRLRNCRRSQIHEEVGGRVEPDERLDKKTQRPAHYPRDSRRRGYPEGVGRRAAPDASWPKQLLSWSAPSPYNRAAATIHAVHGCMGPDTCLSACLIARPPTRIPEIINDASSAKRCACQWPHGRAWAVDPRDPPLFAESVDSIQTASLNRNLVPIANSNPGPILEFQPQPSPHPASTSASTLVPAPTAASLSAAATAGICPSPGPRFSFP